MDITTLTFVTSLFTRLKLYPEKANFYIKSLKVATVLRACMYDLDNLMCVMNPATRWQRSLLQAVVLQ